MQLDNFLPEQVCDMIDMLNRLPSVGRRSAQRLAFYILKQDETFAEELAANILKGRTETVFCHKCYNISSTDECKICANPKRDEGSICVVEGVLDLIAIERSGIFNGTYHVLHGLLSPLDGITPKQLRIDKLVERVASFGENGAELILATPTTSEGDATNIFISEMLKSHDVKISKLASGLPHGGVLDYADEITLKNAFSDRKDY